jgi:hypothetical protein
MPEKLYRYMETAHLLHVQSFQFRYTPTARNLQLATPKG